MARRGFAIDCIELGAGMAALAREKLLAFPKVTVVCDNFETVSLPVTHYDLLLSATAFHWIDPTIRFTRAHDFLKPGGSLALFWHRPVQTSISRHYLDPLQQIYNRICPELTENYHPPPAFDDVTTEYSETIIGSGYFRDLKVFRHYQATEYSAETYIDLLGAFSDHRQIEANKRERLFQGIQALIHAEFAGKIVRETVALLYLARRCQSPQ